MPLADGSSESATEHQADEVSIARMRFKNRALRRQRLNDVRRRLDQLNQNALTAKWKLIIAFGMDKNNIVTGSPFTNSTRGKAQAFTTEPVMGYL
jgi:hypothetical protein